MYIICDKAEIGCRFTDAPRIFNSDNYDCIYAKADTGNGKQFNYCIYAGKDGGESLIFSDSSHEAVMHVWEKLRNAIIEGKKYFSVSACYDNYLKHFDEISSKPAPVSF